MKAKLIAGISALVLVVLLLLMWKPQSFEDRFDDVMQDLTSYELEGDMEITKGEDIKSFALSVAYQKKEKQDLFRVSLYDKELNQEQTIIRNQDGVFVATPSLNQVFQFEGDWPLNTPKPYLLQSMAEIVNSEKTEISEEKEGYLVKSEVDYPNNPTFAKQEMMFDEEGKIKWIQIFDKDNSTQMKLVFHTCTYNKKVKDSVFETPKKLEQKTAAATISEADLPLYPMQVFDAVLQNRSVVETGDKKRYVMEYTGDKNFTVIQSVYAPAEETEVVLMSGEMVDALDLIGFYDGNHMSAIQNGVEFSVFSDDLSLEEMMRVISSMQVAVMK